MDSAAGAFDLFVIHGRADEAETHRLARALEQHGVRPWLAEEQGVTKAGWQREVIEALRAAPACVVVVGPSGLPGEWARRELEEALQRRRHDSQFRLVLVYLPGAHPLEIPGLEVDATVTFHAGFDDETVRELVGAVRSSAAPGQREISVTPSVETATRISGETTAFTIVRRLLEAHTDYMDGKVRPADIGDGPPAAERRPAAAWLAAVRDLYDPRRTDVLHGRLLIDGLARIEPLLRARLDELDALATLRAEISPHPQTLLRPKPDTVDTLTDYPADVDELGRSVFAQVLARRIRRMREEETRRAAASRDPEREAGGAFLLHLYGPWGSGKSTLLNFLRRELSKPEPERWVIIDFNAWQHQRTAPPWWWLMSAVYRQALAALHARGDRVRALKLRAREVWWRASAGLVMLVAALTLAIGIWVLGGLDVLPAEQTTKDVSAVITLALTIGGLAKGLARWLLVGSPRAAGTILEHTRDPMQTLKRRFRRLVTMIGYPVAIFVDDLDRCQAKYVVELLEGVQTLFRDVPVTYVVAADREWVSTAYAREYADFCAATAEPGRPLGYLFLEKTFQLSAPVPVLSSEAQERFWEGLLRVARTSSPAELEQARADARRKFEELPDEEAIQDALRESDATAVQRQAEREAAVLRLAAPEVEERTEHSLRAFAPLLEPNPRAMKLLLNSYGMARATEILGGGEAVRDGSSHEQLALWTIVNLRWPLLAEYLSEHPDEVDAIAGGGQPGDDVPDGLKRLWQDRDVRAVVRGDAPNVHTGLTAAAVRRCAGRREEAAHGPDLLARAAVSA